MDNVKKAYIDIVALLEANANKKVSTVLPLILELVTAKGTTKTFQKDEEGNVTHIFCYYHKEWEAVADVEYGKKSSTATGYNTMCKVGVSAWTKKQRVAKLAKEALLAKVVSGEIPAAELQDHMDAIEAERLSN